MTALWFMVYAAESWLKLLSCHSFLTMIKGHISFLWCPEAMDPTRAQTLTKGGRWQGLGYLVRPGLEPATPNTDRVSRWFLLSVALCAKTGVLPMELGGSWC